MHLASSRVPEVCRTNIETVLYTNQILRLRRRIQGVEDGVHSLANILTGLIFKQGDDVDIEKL